jgi:hypothetical protein
MRKRQPTPSSKGTNPSEPPKPRQMYGDGTPYDEPYEEVTISVREYLYLKRNASLAWVLFIITLICFVFLLVMVILNL